MFGRHGVRVRYARDLPECGEDLGQSLWPVGHHNHALAREATRAPQKIALVSTDGGAFGNAELRTKKIDGPSLSVILSKDGGFGAHIRRQAVVCPGNRSRHLFPAKLIGEQLW